MIAYLLESSVCMILFYGLYHLLFKDTSTHAQNRLYLLSSLLISLVIPLISLPVYQHSSIVPTPSTQPFIGGVTRQIQPEIIAYDWSSIWSLVYAAGVLISLTVLLRRLYHIYRIIKTGESIYHRGTQVIYTATETPLCSFGKYIIAPIDRKGNLTQYELTHEINHTRKRHTIDVVFIKVLRSFFWFNPVLMFYEERLLEVHEYQADEATHYDLGKESYLSFLVDQISRNRQPSLVNNFNSLINKRLIMMNSETRSGKIQYLAILPVLLVVFSLFSFDSYNVYLDTDGNEISIQRDTIPHGAKIDTFTTYHSDLKKEVKYVLVKPHLQNAYLIINENPEINSIGRIDTLMKIDYDTYAETTVVINYQTGVIDTITNF